MARAEIPISKLRKRIDHHDRDKVDLWVIRQIERASSRKREKDKNG